MVEGDDERAGAIARAMVRLRRSQNRRTLARLSHRRSRDAGPSDAVITVLDAVEAGASTVTEVAGALGIDQPRASRRAAQAREAGLLRRVADQDDGRRSLLVLTRRGRQALDHVHHFRRRIVSDAIASWSDRDRDDFARLLTRFIDDFAAVTDQP